MARVAFVMEQHIGHQTYYQNLRSAIEQDGRIDALWTPVTYHGAHKLLEYASMLPEKLRGTLHGMFQTRRALRRKNYDVIFFCTQVPGALAGNLARRRPYLVATDITPVQYDQMSAFYKHEPDKGGLLTAYKRRVNQHLFCGAAWMLPWSNWAGDSLVVDYGVERARLEVVPPGVDLQRWTPNVRVGEQPMRILFVGGDLYRKGGDTLLRAFRALGSGTAELHLVTQTRIEPEEGIHTYYNLKPNSPELIRLYREADVFVLPADAEAFGIAAVEASAAGLATIATAVGGLSDIVAHGESGYLITPGDMTMLVTHLKRLAGDVGLRTRMARAARARAEQHFDAKQNAGRIISHLLEVASRASLVAQAAY